MSLVKTLPLLLSLSAALGSVSAWALPNDNEQPIRIQANEAQLDDKQGIATYKGDVIITQGSMKITGNTVTITRNAAGEIDVVTSVGNLAYFEQLGGPRPPARWMARWLDLRGEVRCYTILERDLQIVSQALMVA